MERKKRLRKQTLLLPARSSPNSIPASENGSVLPTLFTHVPIMGLAGVGYYMTGFMGFLIIGLGAGGLLLMLLAHSFFSRAAPAFELKDLRALAPPEPLELERDASESNESSTGGPSGQPFGVPDI